MISDGELQPYNRNIIVDALINIFLVISIPLIVVIGPILDIENMITYFFVTFLLLISFHVNHYKIKIFKPVIYYSIFVVVSSLSVINAHYLDLYSINMKTIIGTLIFGITLYNFVIADLKYLKIILWSYILSTYILAVYFYSKGLLSLSLIDNTSFRLGGNIFDPNSIVYYIFLAIFATIILSLLSNRWRDRYIYLISLPLWIILVFLSSSRGGLGVFLLVNILYWPYIGLVRKINFYKSTLFLLVLLILLWPAANYVYYHYLINSSIVVRYNLLISQGENTARFLLLKDAFRVFLGHPLFGVGAGNYVLLSRYHQFSHNNFMEILVNQGVVALSFYVMSLLSLVRIVWLFLKEKQTQVDRKIAAVIMLFMFTFAVYSFLYPFFELIAFTGFIFVLFGIAYRLRLEGTVT